MKIVVIGGTGLIGMKTVAILRQGGHEVVAASPQSGVKARSRMTANFQGWLFFPEGVHEPDSRTSLTASSETSAPVN